MKILRALLPLVLLSTSVTAAAEEAPAVECGMAFSARFYEGAPRDRFKLTNLSDLAWQIKAVSLDLDGSVGKLIFDTKDGGTGVEVFQPYKTEQGEALLLDIEVPSDGDQQIGLMFRDFKASESFVFSIDVDDQLTNSALGQIRVAGGELSGSKLVVEFVNSNGDVQTHHAEFSADNLARIDLGSCN